MKKEYEVITDEVELPSSLLVSPVSSTDESLEKMFRAKVLQKVPSGREYPLRPEWPSTTATISEVS